MNRLKSIRLSRVTLAIVCGCAIAFLLTEAKRLKRTQWALAGGVAGAIAPYVFKYAEDRIKERQQHLNERISKLEVEIKAIKIDIDRRVDLVEGEIPRISSIVDSNKEAASTAINATEQLRGEIYSARGEAQNAGKIAELALDVAQDAQGRINHVLTSGSLIKVSNQVTIHEIKIAILEKKIKNGKNSGD